MHSEHTLYSWSFPEYTVHQREKSWYIWAVAIFIIFLSYAILTANFLFGLIIILTTIIIFIKHNRQPDNIVCHITKEGLEIDNKKYSFKEIKKFWLLYEPPEVKNIYFDFKATFQPTLNLPLGNENPLKIRQILKEYLTEDLAKENESTADALARVLKIS